MKPFPQSVTLAGKKLEKSISQTSSICGGRATSRVDAQNQRGG
ncbi:MAG TPA: hypothetical protein VGQ95_06430 [Chthoniobacterales bacterium]|nr:hypothetical protein [Chthoniobacterales bacterium]